MQGTPSSARGQGRWQSAVVLAVFLLPLLAYWIYAIWINPSHNYYVVDTEFPYFLNSLAVFKGGSYTYADHPGTPVEEIGTAILAMQYVLRGQAPAAFIASEVGNPGSFLDVAHGVLILANLLCVIAIFLAGGGRAGWQWAAAAAAVATMYFAIQPSALGDSGLWNHNSFSFPLGTALLAGWFAYLRGSATGREPSKWHLILFGLGAGILAAVQIYLAAWLAGMMVTILVYYALRGRRWQQAAMAEGIIGVSGLAGFYAAVLPIGRKVSIFWNWAISILTNQSKYLAVPQDQPMSGRLLENLGNFYSMLPILCIVTIVLVVAAIASFIVYRSRLRERSGIWALTAGLVVQTLILLVLFLDHPLRDAYFLSIAATLPMLALALLMAWDLKPTAAAAIRIGLGAAVLAGITVNAAQSITAKAEETAMMRATEAETARAIEAYATQTGKSPQDLTILWMYGSFSPCWGLRTGDALTNDAFANEIDAVCPRQYRVGLNLRFDVHGDDVPVDSAKWDIIFTCDRYLQKFDGLYTPDMLQSLPSVQWGCGGMDVIVRQ